MKVQKQRKDFIPSGFFVFRTPLLPFQEFLNWNDGVTDLSASDNPARLQEALTLNQALLRERLSIIMSRPAVWDAVFVASPDLDKFLDLWRREPETKRGQNTERALVRYFSRMTSRTTPFGLFAGTSIGLVGDKTQLTLEKRTAYKRHTRLSMDYLCALVDALAHDSSLKNAFLYRPNSSLYLALGRVRYVESRLDEKQNRSYHLVSAENTDYLQSTLERSRDGTSRAALAKALVTEEISFAAADEYIGKLIESQLIVPDIALPITGPEPISFLIERLRKSKQTDEVADLLDQVRSELKEIDATGLGVAPAPYRAVARALESLPPKVVLSKLFQVDMMKPSPGAVLGQEVIDEIMRAVEILHSMDQPRQESEIKRFREAFVARYEEREVPLVEALDQEIGIGFGQSTEATPLLKGLLFPDTQENYGPMDKRQTLLLRKLSEALQRGAHEIFLDTTELETMKAKEPQPLPNDFAVVATLLSFAPTETITGDEFRVVITGTTGPSGARLLGRFCHLDQTLRQHVERALRAEESFLPKAIFAEIVHLPEARIGNALLRPVLRDYEIPYLSQSSVAHDKQISITDLYISVRDERVRLRSASLGREVIPRMTNGHNYDSLGLEVYRFLCALQEQDVTAGLGWNWGTLSGAPFLPRVSTGRLILSLACWRISKEELRVIGQPRGAARFRAVQEWREARQLPRLVALADYDNLLPVDLDNVLSVESFVHLTKEREEARLVECYPEPEQLCAFGPEGRFVHELIVPFAKSRDQAGGPREEERTTAFHSSPITHHSSLRRRFPPGSEWLYAKCYTGTATLDYVLRDVVRPLTENALRSGAADRWFFVRYGDPDWHLRLRFHGVPKNLYTDVLPALESAMLPLLDDGRLWRMQLDTYEREVERYGGAEGIALAEQFFHLDSDAALEIVEMLEPGDEGAEERWRLTVRSIDMLLADFGFNLRERHAILERARDGFSREFRVDKDLKSQLSDKFRKERKNIELLVDAAHDEESLLVPGFEVLSRRSERLAPIVAELKSCEQKGRLSVSVPELMMSYIHLQGNRLLRSAQRRQELVIYDLLTRHYESRIARVG